MKYWTIFGAGNFIYDIVDAILSRGEWVREIVLNEPLVDMINLDYPIIAFDAFKPVSRSQYIFGFINSHKDRFLEQLQSHNLTFSNLVHSRAYVADSVYLGKGNFIGAGAVIAPKVCLGHFNVINRMVSIGHHTQLGNLNHLGPGATVCGKVELGNKNFIGAGATVLDGIKIKDEITLGGGGVAVRDLEEPGVYIGVPAKKRV